MGLSRASGRVSLITPECLRCISCEEQRQTTKEAKRSGKRSAREAPEKRNKGSGKQSRDSDEVRWSDEWHTGVASGKTCTQTCHGFDDTS